MGMSYKVYEDIAKRTNHEIYLGVVGPVRTGKSTFIKRFMELMVFPNLIEDDEKIRKRMEDELPQAGTGKTIMTTKPQFVPNVPYEVMVGDEKIKIRLCDCVGFMVDGAMGHMEDEKERMIKTPWFDEEIPFLKAAEIGTKKVITDHANIGILMMTDGSFSELTYDAYLKAFEKTVEELRSCKKPFISILNCVDANSKKTIELAKKLEDTYKICVLPMNCEQMTKEDITNILSGALLQFPVTTLNFTYPSWISFLPEHSPMKTELISLSKQILDRFLSMGDVTSFFEPENMPAFLKEISIKKIDYSKGVVNIQFVIYEKEYFKIVSKLSRFPIANEYDLLSTFYELACKKDMFDSLDKAMKNIHENGYGVVSPTRDQISLEEPTIIKQGNKYGIKMKATAPTLHLIEAQIETEIAPIVGTKEQADDLCAYLVSEMEKKDQILDTNIFGKSTLQIVEEGIDEKISQMTLECQQKLKETLKKIMNDSSGSMIFIIM